MGSIEGTVGRSSRIQGVVEGSGSSSSTRLNTLNLGGKNVFSFICWHVPDHEVETTRRTELFLPTTEYHKGYNSDFFMSRK